MGYVALYRLYRPSDFQDLIGQEHIKKTIQNALKRRKFAHAYLFTGPRGTGKTSTAKLIGKAVNCLSPKENGEPCNECANCKSVANGTMSDIIEIDAASNNGVDEIRNIRDQVHFAPSQGKYKVYIIDEVHMLSVGAFNALLKTLEEPPAHVIFILATTEPHKIPMTIISRCQRFDFRRISPAAIVERMKYIVQDQGLDVEEGALQLIASIAQGGMRDALSLLDQAIAYADGKVTVNDVTAIVGKTSISFVGKVVESIAEGDISAVIDQVDEIIENGKEPEYFIEDLIGYYRDILLFKTTRNPEHLNTAVVDDTFKSLVNRIDKKVVQEIIKELLECQSMLKWSSQTKTSIEVALVKIMDIKSSYEAADTKSETIAEPQLHNSPIIGTLINQVGTLQEELRKLKTQGLSHVSSYSDSVSGLKKNFPNSREIIENEVLPYATKAYRDFVRKKFNQVLTIIGNVNIGLYRMLSEGQPVLCSKSHLVISFPTQKQVEIGYDRMNIEMLEKAIDEVIGQPLRIVYIQADEWEQIKADYKKKLSAQKANQIRH
jgi:DNA polymerase III subunit gamma/tau